MSGCVQFTVRSGSLSIGGVVVSSGSVLRICLNGDSALTWWIGSDGWVSASDLDVSAVYVNGVQVASSTKVSISGIQADLSTITSTLTITLSGSGYTQLTWNGQTIISRTDSRTLTITGVTASTTKPMNINIGTSIYAEGLATTYTIE